MPHNAGLESRPPEECLFLPPSPRSAILFRALEQSRSDRIEVGSCSQERWNPRGIRRGGQFKAWLDRVAQAGRTFGSGESGSAPVAGRFVLGRQPIFGATFKKVPRRPAPVFNPQSTRAYGCWPAPQKNREHERKSGIPGAGRGGTSRLHADIERWKRARRTN